MTWIEVFEMPAIWMIPLFDRSFPLFRNSFRDYWFVQQQVPLLRWDLLRAQCLVVHWQPRNGRPTSRNFRFRHFRVRHFRLRHFWFRHGRLRHFRFTLVGIWNSEFWMVEKRLVCKWSRLQMGSEIQNPYHLKNIDAIVPWLVDNK